ncbi:hypothetical protein DFH06DRAFT_1417693 [Mycena polygramma]|nr:hypothetical protein DFH06DRAFT_1417693 [Mycena polygramma]
MITGVRRFTVLEISTHQKDGGANEVQRRHLLLRPIAPESTRIDKTSCAAHFQKGYNHGTDWEYVQLLSAVCFKLHRRFRWSWDYYGLGTVEFNLGLRTTAGGIQENGSQDSSDESNHFEWQKSTVSAAREQLQHVPEVAAVPEPKRPQVMAINHDDMNGKCRGLVQLLTRTATMAQNPGQPHCPPPKTTCCWTVDLAKSWSKPKGTSKQLSSLPDFSHRDGGSGYRSTTSPDPAGSLATIEVTGVG